MLTVSLFLFLFMGVMLLIFQLCDFPTSEAYSYENMIAHKTQNGIRVARFESDLYKGNSADMSVFKAKYSGQALESIEKEDITVKNNEEKEIISETTTSNIRLKIRLVFFFASSS